MLLRVLELHWEWAVDCDGTFTTVSLRCSRDIRLMTQKRCVYELSRLQQAKETRRKSVSVSTSLVVSPSWSWWFPYKPNLIHLGARYKLLFAWPILPVKVLDTGHYDF